MLKPIDKPTRRPLVHHPSDVLDAFCRCDATSRKWQKFDTSLSRQIRLLESNNRQYIRVRPMLTRRSSL